MTDPNLQFDRAEPTGGAGATQCAVCQRPIADQYYSANGKPVCASCREKISTQLANKTGNLPGGILLGVGGAALGAAAYFGVAALTGAEIALVAIAVGWLVGRAVQLGSGGSGSRVQQVVAVVLTFLSLDAAYLAMVVKARMDGLGLGLQAAISTTLRGPIQTWIALPITDNLASLPMGLLGLLIVGFGILQAWRMNAPVTITVEGPFQIGPAKPAGGP